MKIGIIVIESGVIKMTVTTSVTKIELNADERDILRKAIEILKGVNNIINNDNVDYVVDSIDMDLYNSIYGAIDRIENYIMIQ